LKSRWNVPFFSFREIQRGQQRQVLREHRQQRRPQLLLEVVDLGVQDPRLARERRARCGRRRPGCFVVCCSIRL
jgi:hypothetical protein